MILRIIFSLAIKMIIDLPLQIIGLIVVPIALHYESQNHLPAWAEWCWGNKDHGNDGEKFWAAKTVGWARFWRCFWWLALRNPTFNWGKYILGIKSDGTAKIVKGTTTPIGDTRASGWYYAKENLLFEFYYIKAYSIFGLNRCIRFRCGWKIVGCKNGEYAQFCFSPNPFHNYTGI